ncbi:hypothetical protein BDY21DRAFT_367057 [Lineolata rhizophorae]|uniref:SMP-30/Gluconolactonase/LRE-like region domain-containing protein n=1 Tax=Lineolata rhizophorae TaxID=578093 RepID=A0A6A6NNM3_9PEZI|nr:hypothetical protein BDY21DRAFT_367057 [Lineolata rhizophorae]
MVRKDLLCARKIELIHQFQKGTVVADITKCTQNTGFLVALLDRPDIWWVDGISGSSGEPQFLAGIKGVTSSFGITPIGRPLINSNSYAVVAGNVSGSTMSPVPGSFAVYRLMLKEYPGWLPGVRMDRIADIPDAGLLKGITTVPGIPSSDLTVLIADSMNGTVYYVNLESGYQEVVIAGEETMAPLFWEGEPLEGVNSLYYESSTHMLYYTNSIKGLFARIPLDWATYHPVGEAEIIADAIGDDIVLDQQRLKAYLPGGSSNQMYEIGLQDGSVRVIAGGLEDPTVAGATCAFLDRDNDSLIIGTVGTQLATIANVRPEGGKIMRLDISDE